MEARRCRRRTASAAAAAARRRLCSLLALAGDYLKYLLTKRGRFLGRVARRSLAALLLSSGGGGKPCLATAPWPPCALAEREFSCSNSPSPAFLAARRLRSRLKRRAGAASCFGALRSPCGCGPSATEAADQEEEEEDEEIDQYGAWECGGGELIDVDYRAEEFINMFYEQLRAQSFHPPTVLQCRSP
ncbi:hypothetical protein OsI_07417 [Oryza sativa Indica Group]|jgi:hypothetical protein|uniref:Uncharacterized protein n=1 Tax=Oryza sativa subsp. indica TaxID=39946 RepID=A2X5E1_ORYSI|nr:hypothetical protein OsI_07417 [Oryza sativa Indica Group]